MWNVKGEEKGTGDVQDYVGCPEAGRPHTDLREFFRLDVEDSFGS